MIIRIPNVALFIEGERKLSPDETIVFAWLHKYHNADSIFVTSIDLISAVFKFQSGRDRRNKTHVREILISLEQKQYIQSNVTELTEYDDLITGTIVNLKEDYSGIDSSILDELLKEDLTKAKLKFYIYADANRYQRGNRLSYSIISDKCNYFNSNKNHSVTIIQEVVNEMDGKLIYRFSGDRHEGSPRQDENTYISSKYITEDKKRSYVKHVESKAVKKAAFRKDTELVKSNSMHGDDMTVKELKEYLRESNWGKRNPYSGAFEELEYDDYFLYRLAKDENVATTFIYKLDRAIEAMKDNIELPYDFDQWEQQYLEDTREDEYEAEAI